MPHHLAAQMRSMPTAAAIAPSRATGQAYQLARPAGAGVEATSCRLNETAAVCLIPISGLPHSYVISGAPNDMENPEMYMYHHGVFLFVYQKKSHKPACQVLSAKRLACAACALLCRHLTAATCSRPILFQWMVSPCRLLLANTDPRQDLPVSAATIASAFLVTTRTITKSSHITSLFTPTIIPLASRADHPSAQPDEDPHLRRPLLGVGRRPPRPSRRRDRPSWGSRPVLCPRRREGHRMRCHQPLPPSEVLWRTRLRAGQRPEALRRTIRSSSSSHVRSGE